MQNGWSSLAISCGTNYPPATAAKAIVDTVAEFLDERKSFRIEIRLIDSSDQVVNYLHEMLIEKFGKAVVKIEELEQSNSVLASPVRVGITPGMTAKTYLYDSSFMIVIIFPEVHIIIIISCTSNKSSRSSSNSSSKKTST